MLAPQAVMLERRPHSRALAQLATTGGWFWRVCWPRAGDEPLIGLLIGLPAALVRLILA